MRALVISGGGAWGSLNVGTLAALNRNYKIVAGVSTGSLMAPLAALGEWERLKEAYTSVSQKDIFDFNPFHSNGKINVVKALYRAILRKPTVGESNNLRKTIDRFLTEDDIIRIRKEGKQVVVACQETSVSPEKIYHFSTKDQLVDDFKDFMWASANAPGVMSILYKNDREWTDAGVTELLSLAKVVQMGATEIDVMIHRTRPEIYNKGRVKDIFHNLSRLFDIMRKEVERNDIEYGLELAKQKGCKVNIYWLPKKLSANSLVFDKKQMAEWVNLGYDTAFAESRIDRYDFSKAYQMVS